MAEEKEVIEEIAPGRGRWQTSPYRSEGLTICVAIESNTSQWHTAANWRIHE